MPPTKRYLILILGILFIPLTACAGKDVQVSTNPLPSQTEGGKPPTEAVPTLAASVTSIPTTTPTADPTAEDKLTEIQAAVISVEITGSPEQYSFRVGVASPDTGCEQYADWWEVISEDGILLYRRILLHSHVTEQPFVRSGGPVQIGPDTVVIVRAHMNEASYGLQAMKGSVDTGFSPITLPEGFGVGLESQAPLPTGCNF